MASLSAPALEGAKDWFVITPSDDDDVTPVVRAIRADTDGLIVATGWGADADPVEFNVVAGEVLQISPRFLNEDTTATVIGFV